MARIDKTIKFASNIETAVMITDNLTQNLLRTIEKLSKNEPSSKLTKHDYDVNPVSSGKALEDNNVLPCHVLFTVHNVKPAVNTTASQNKLPLIGTPMTKTASKRIVIKFVIDKTK